MPEPTVVFLPARGVPYPERLIGGHKRGELAQAFKVEVHDRAAEVDPDSDYPWLHLTVGWAIGKGLSPEDANEFASYIRYETDLG